MLFRRTNLVLIGIMVVIAVAILASTMVVSYETAFEQTRQNIARTAISQARLLEAVADFDQSHNDDYPDGSVAATISQIRNAYQSLERMGETGEFLLARSQRNNIRFLLISPGEGDTVPDAVPIDSEFAEPMRRALAGKSGTMVGPDYDGIPVLAAYQPVAVLDLGIVVKVDIAEIRAPFLQAGGFLVVFSMVLTAIGSFLFFRVSNPLVQRLETSERRYARAVAGTNEGLWEWHIQSQKGYFSPRFAEILGYDPNDLLPDRETLDKLTHPDDRDRVRRKSLAHRELNAPYDVDLRMRKKSGDYLWVQSRASASKDKDGRLAFMSGSITDITERKRAEHELKDSEARLRLIMDSVPVGITYVDRELRYRFASEGYIKLLGLPSRQLVGKSVRTIMSEQAYQKIEPFAKRALAGEKIAFNHILHTKDGREIYVAAEYIPHKEPNKAVSGFFALIKDLTEEKEYQAALFESEERFRAIFETIDTGIVVIDTKGEIINLNPAAVTLFGYQPDMILGENVSILVPESMRGEHNGFIGRYLETGEARIIGQSSTTVGTHKSGKTFPIQLTIGEMQVEGRTCFVGSVTDLTKVQSLEDQLRQSQKLEAVGQLTGGIAHDFNNLLAVIQGNLSLLADDLQAGDSAIYQPMEYIQPSLDASKRGADLIQRLLAFSRKQALSPRAVDLNKLILSLEDLLRSTLGETIKLELKMRDGGWWARIDPSQLESALLNLALNSRDAMAKGGRLTIATEDVNLTEDFTAKHPETKAGDYVMLAVSDTGEGMTPEVRRRVFDPFFTTKEVGKGSGLGLSMIHGFVTQSGGFVEIDSGANKGTTIRLFLPRSEAPQDKAGAPAEATSVVGGKETILVVEDDADVRRMTVRMLDFLGYQVTEAEDARSALAALSAMGPVDLLLSDVVLSHGMSGPEMVSLALEKIPDLKVLYMSGYTEGAIMDNGGLDPVVNLIGKPFSRADLGAKVRDVLKAPAQATT